MQATYGLGGYGLLITPVASCRVMVTDDRELVFAYEGRELARITPGDNAAPAGEPTWLAGGMAQFGEGGPLLELADGVEYEAVFVQIDAGLSPVEWQALTVGMMMELPANVVLIPAAPDDADPYFELHALGGTDEFISFMPRPVNANDVVINPAPYQRLVQRGRTPDDIPFTECAYEYQGVTWRQIYYAVPVEDGTVVVRAQASAHRVEALFGAAQVAASTLAPL
jgi:hypothetical protein